ncbi:hypothetical protein NEOLEDRAFT_1178388 [Neolentinus lepideus HHB14362 ss-1]|uniref:Uncharacterized protein n=1 Tax=Neolentinus lepideus HHB14362 ss-1 TaxID=1314782 RepID=A0A165SSL9_9AGAM|nr:hypothetical protein NEOLEDRAFT_1178388 [Neolentinus lepideus HHB14362 ss-1]
MDTVTLSSILTRLEQLEASSSVTVAEEVHLEGKLDQLLSLVSGLASGVHTPHSPSGIPVSSHPGDHLVIPHSFATPPSLVTLQFNCEVSIPVHPLLPISGVPSYICSSVIKSGDATSFAPLHLPDPPDFDGTCEHGQHFLDLVSTHLGPFTDDQMRIQWALCFFKSGQATNFVTRVLKVGQEAGGPISRTGPALRLSSYESSAYLMSKQMPVGIQ